MQKNNPYKGFAYQVIQRVVTVRNANSLGAFERVGNVKFVPEYHYDDTPVDGCDFLVNAAKYASDYRKANQRKNVVFFIIETSSNQTVM